MNRRTRPAVTTALLLPALALSACGAPWWSGDPVSAADSTAAVSSPSGATPSGSPGAGATPAGATAPVPGAPASAASWPAGTASDGSTSDASPGGSSGGSTSAGPVSPAPSGRASATAGAPSSSSPAVPTAPVPAAGEPAPCSAPDLEIAVVDTGGSADAGGVSRQLTISNPGADCTLSGFPVITYQSAPGRIVGAPAGHFGEPGPATVLESGQMTTVALREQQAGKYGPECRPTDVPLLAVALADGGATAYLDRPATACASTAIELLQTGPYDS